MRTSLFKPSRHLFSEVPHQNLLKIDKELPGNIYQVLELFPEPPFSQELNTVRKHPPSIAISRSYSSTPGSYHFRNQS